MPEGRRTINVQKPSVDLPKREDLPKLSKKQLAEYIYDLYIDINIVDPKSGVGKEEWVRRILNGAGAAQPAKKEELVRQLGGILDDRDNDLNLINGLMQGDELLLSSVMLAQRFSRNALETELDARDDTAIPDERNVTLAGYSTEELFDVVTNYRAYHRPEALQMAQAMTNAYDERNAINYRAFVEEIIDNEYENRPSYMDGLVYHRIHSFFAMQRDEGLEDLDDRQYKALYQAHLDGDNLLENLGQEYNTNFEGRITSDKDVQRLIEQYTYTLFSNRSVNTADNRAELRSVIQKEFDTFKAAEMKRPAEEIFANITRIRFFTEVSNFLTNEADVAALPDATVNGLLSESPNTLNLLYDYYLKMERYGVDNADQVHELINNYAEDYYPQNGAADTRTAEELLKEPLYGLCYNWKGLKEENTVYTSAQLSAEDPNFNPELDVQDGAFAANKTYIVYKLNGATAEETAANVKAFMTGSKNDTFEGGNMPEGWYWETIDMNLFTGEYNPTAKKLIEHFGLTDADLRMQEPEPELSPLEKLKIQAAEYVKSTGKPHVLIEWSESGAVPNETIMTFEDADRLLRSLNFSFQDVGYDKTKLHIFYQDGDDVNSYGELRFDIGTERAGLIEHIEDYANNSDLITAGFTNAEEKQGRLHVANILKEYMQGIYTKENLEAEVQRWRNDNYENFRAGKITEYKPFPNYMAVPYNEFSEASGWGCAIEELNVWGKEHQKGTPAQKQWIIDYLEDINFHTAAEFLDKGNYTEFFNYVEQERISYKLEDIRQQGVSLQKLELRINLASKYTLEELQSEIAVRMSSQDVRSKLHQDLANVSDEDLYATVKDFDTYESNHAPTILRVYKNFALPTAEELAAEEPGAVNTFCTDFGGEYAYFIANDGLSIDDICTAYAERPYDGFGYQFGKSITAKQFAEIQEAGKGYNIDFLDDINSFTITQDGKVIDSGYLYEDLVLKYQDRIQAQLPVTVQEEQPKHTPKQKQNIKTVLGGKYNADELQKYLTKELEENALKNAQSEKEFLSFLSSFKSRQYSLRNQLMLYIQAAQNGYMPIFGTFEEWKGKGTSIQPGTHGLTICRPIFTDVYYENVNVDGEIKKQRYVKFATTKEKLKELEDGVKAGTVEKKSELTHFIYTDSVFSMSQTTMTEEQRIDYLQRYNARNTSTENAELYEKLKAIAGEIGRPVVEKSIQGEELGWVERAANGEIVIKKDMPIDAKISVLAHEIGHKLLHIQNATAENRAQKEVQAQLFSHLAMLKLGIDAEKQFSLSYINNWIKAAEKNPPVFDANGRELSKGEVLQLNLAAVLPAVDALIKTVGEKQQPIDTEALKELKDYKAEKPQPEQRKPVKKEGKVEIEPLRVVKETDKAVMVKLSGENPEDPKKGVWLPKSQISINKDGYVFEATPTLIKEKGLTPKAALKETKGLRAQRSLKL